MNENKKKKNVDSLEYGKYTYIPKLLVWTHVLLEVLYVVVNCTPMIFINIISILVHLSALQNMKKGNIVVSVFTMLIEVYLHVILAAFFMGYDCGFTFWYYGLFCAIFMPAIDIKTSPLQRKSIRMLGVIIIFTYLCYLFVARHGLFISRYNIPLKTTNTLLYINSVISFLSILAYTSAYTKSKDHETAELHGMATHDYLTGLYNRQRLQKIIYWDRYDMEEKTYSEMSVAIMDIDFFKNVNDTYGHLAGDYVLKELAMILLRFASEGITVGRWGGEEFIIIASEEVSYDDFEKFLEKLRAKIEDYDFYFEDRNIKITVSIGASHVEPVDEAKPFIKLADERLYEAKNTGRNKIVTK